MVVSFVNGASRPLSPLGVFRYRLLNLLLHWEEGERCLRVEDLGNIPFSGLFHTHLSMKLLILADKHIEANSDDFLDGHSLDVGDGSYLTHHIWINHGADYLIAWFLLSPGR